MFSGTINLQMHNIKDLPLYSLNIFEMLLFSPNCFKFVQREIRRGKKYDAIILDPPSYGRGPNGEMWKLENNLFDFLKECKIGRAHV